MKARISILSKRPHLFTHLVVLLGATVLFPLSSPAPLTGYIKIGDIPGESQATDHEEEIDIHDIQWAIEQGDSAIGGGGGAGKVSMKDMTLWKELDKATPKLMEACATGVPIPTVVFSLRQEPQEGEAHLDYLIITMEDVRVTSISSSSRGDRARPEEQVSLNFSRIEFQYIPQDPATGRPQEPVIFTWNFADGTAN